MRSTKRSFLHCILIVSTFALTGTAFASQQLSVLCVDNVPTTNFTTCTIRNPIVTQAMTVYDGQFHNEIFETPDGTTQNFGLTVPAIQLRAGDSVSVTANGCVQTGLQNGGKRWRRYVDPEQFSFGPIVTRPDPSHHGVLGVTNAFQTSDGSPMPNPISLLDQDRHHTFINFWVGTDQFLNLGYQDDNYADNGYWAHDDGNPKQCVDLPPGPPDQPEVPSGTAAVVTVIIEHNTPEPFHLLAWDLIDADLEVSEVRDTNVFRFNPRWGWQATAGEPQSIGDCVATAPAKCVSQPLKSDVPIIPAFGVTCNGILNPKGHINWDLVSYKGRIFWDEHSWPDDDYNFFMDTPDTNGHSSGITRQNDTVKLEFKASETIDHFVKSTYWQHLRSLVDGSTEETCSDDGICTIPPEAIQAGNDLIKLVNGKEAFVVGLMGLDDEHEDTSEVHPVYAMAIHSNEDPHDDTWQIFVRNFGNEGWCSRKMHYANFAGGTVWLRLPRPANVPDTATATVTSNTFWGNVNFLLPNVFSVPRVDTQVAFNIPAPPNDGSEGAREYGEIHLKWSEFDPGAGSEGGGGPQAFNPPNEVDMQSSEEQLNQLYRHLPDAQRAAVKALLPPFDQTGDTLPGLTNFTPVPPPPGPVDSEAVDSRQDQRRQDVIKSLCGGLNGQTSLDQASCTNNLPFTVLTHTGRVGVNNWFTTPVSVTLTAVDLSAKGIDHTEFSFDNKTFTRYAGTFSLPEGITTVFYRSEESTGLFETTKRGTFKVDTIAPESTLTVGSPQFAGGAISSMTPLTLNGTDSGSGISSVAYRFSPQGSSPGGFTVQPGSTVQFKLTGPDGAYQVDTLVTDVAGNTKAGSQLVQLTNSADLAILNVTVVNPPSSFVLVGSPINLTLRTVFTDLGPVNPEDSVLTRTGSGTTGLTLTPTTTSQNELGLGPNEQRTRDFNFTTSCLARSTNAVTLASQVALTTSAGSITDPNPANNTGQTTLTIVCKVPWKPGTAYNVNDEVVFNGLVYLCRQAHTSQTGWEPPNTFALWQRDKADTGGTWAPQVLYNIGDVVLFQGHHYKALQPEQSQLGWEPPKVPNLWQRLD